ncbi:MAG: L-tyrosine/L-tryptophan isonitrile synthase family protein, partial [Thermocrispum sp.]
SLDDVPHLKGVSYDALRAEFDDNYGEPSHAIREKVRAGGETLVLYRAITRFLFEDALTPQRTETRSALQRSARKRAYGVIRRSRAWGRLVADHFPNTVRLSIHPQRCGSPKFGIRLTPRNDTWLTPWHAVAVDSPDGFVLRRRDEAERHGARPVRRNGRLSHYESPWPASDAGPVSGGRRLAPPTHTTDASH